MASEALSGPFHNDCNLQLYLIFGFPQECYNGPACGRKNDPEILIMHRCTLCIDVHKLWNVQCFVQTYL